MFHDLISRIMQKRGIKSVEKLSKEEKDTFDDWQKVLSKKELTIADVKEFCKMQIDVIEAKWADYNNEEHKQSLIPYHTTYRLILRAISSPQQAREALEKNLVQLINQKD